MNKEERKTIEYLKERFELFEEDDVLAKWDYEAINTMLGLIDKLQKENKDMREELQMYVDTDVMKLQLENKELKKTIEQLENTIVELSTAMEE